MRQSKRRSHRTGQDCEDHDNKTRRSVTLAIMVFTSVSSVVLPIFSMYYHFERESRINDVVTKLVSRAAP